MKVISKHGEVLEYVNRLGFGSPGKPIAWRQSDLCVVADAIEKAAGIPAGKLENYPFYDAPFRVCFHPYTSDAGYRFPWLGRFTVIGSNGRQTVHCTDLKV
jgi:hypothetical protein